MRWYVSHHFDSITIIIVMWTDLHVMVGEVDQQEQLLGLVG